MSRGGVEQGPASSAVARTGSAAASLAGAAARINQGAQIVEAVSGNHSCSDELPESGFNFGFEAARGANNVSEE